METCYVVCPQLFPRLDSNVFWVEENSPLSCVITTSWIQQYDSVITAFKGWLFSKNQSGKSGLVVCLVTLLSSLPHLLPSHCRLCGSVPSFHVCSVGFKCNRTSQGVSQVAKRNWPGKVRSSLDDKLPPLGSVWFFICNNFNHSFVV